MLKKISLVATFWTIFYVLAHLFLGADLNLTWLLPSLVYSWLGFFSLAGVLSLWNLTKFPRFGMFVSSILFLFPGLQFLYYRTYSNFLEPQLISAMLREPQFILFTAQTYLTQYLAPILVLVAVSSGVVFVLHRPSQALKEQEKSQPHPLFIFSKWWVLALMGLLIGSQIKWSLKHDMAQLMFRPFYPVIVFAFVSYLIFCFKAKKRTAWMALVAVLSFIFLTAFFNTQGRKWRKELVFDAQFMAAFMNSYFMLQANPSLRQNDEALEKYAQLPPAKMAFNVLLVINDSLRASSLASDGYERPTDVALQDFYKKSVRFDWAYTPSNFTDTSVPATFSGVASDQHPHVIRSQLTAWDYFAKSAATFYIVTQDSHWAKLNEFYRSVGQQHLWSAARDSGKAEKLDYVDDQIALDHLLEYIGDKEYFAGVWHTNGSHYPYYQKEGFTPYQPCDANQANWPRTLINCYDNGITYLSHLLKKMTDSIDLESTVVVFLSDHGEGFNEHGDYFHNQDLHQQALRVPFVWYIPPKIKEKIPAQAWAHFMANTQTAVSTLDTVPTLLRLHEFASGQNLRPPDAYYSGKDLFDDQSERVVFASGCFIDYRCYMRDIAFISKDLHVIFAPDEKQEQVMIYRRDDKVQSSQVDQTQYQKELEFLVQRAAETHPMGRALQSILRY